MFSFKPRASNVIRKDYDVIITEILNKSKITSEIEESKSICKPSPVHQLLKKQFLVKKQAPKAEYRDQMEITLTTTKYVTTFKRSVFIPTVIAVLPNKKTNRFEKRNNLAEQRNKRLIEKHSANTTVSADNQNDKFSFNLNKLTENLNNLSFDTSRRRDYDDLRFSFTSVNLTSNNLLNQIRSKIKKRKCNI